MYVSQYNDIKVKKNRQFKKNDQKGVNVKKSVYSMIILLCFTWHVYSGRQFSQRPSTQMQYEHLFSGFTADHPGVTAVVTRSGIVIFRKECGMANMEHLVPIRSSTRFNIASVSKQMTAYAILLLEQEGRLHLDDPIKKYIPELPDCTNNVTIDQLLHHSSGIRSYTSLMPLAGWRNLEEIITQKQVFKMILRQKALDFEPGTSFRYSNSGYFLLAELIQRVTQQTFPEFMKNRVFTALSMNQTLCRDTYQQIIHDTAESYGSRANGELMKMLYLTDCFGASNIYSSSSDLIKWTNFLRYLKVQHKKLFARMMAEGVLNDGTLCGYSTGFYIDEYRGLKLVHHSGGTAGYRSKISWFPEQDVFIIILANHMNTDPSSLTFQLADIVLKDALGPSPTLHDVTNTIKEIPLELKKKYAGSYRHRSGMQLTVHLHDEALLIDLPGMADKELLAESENFFSLSNEPQSFSFHSYQNGRMFLRMHQDDKQYVFDKMDVPNITPSELEEFTGCYYSEELQTAYTVLIETDELIAVHQRNDPVKLKINQKDQFSGSTWWLRKIHFERDTKKSVIGLFMDGFRSTRIHFRKISAGDYPCPDSGLWGKTAGNHCSRSLLIRPKSVPLSFDSSLISADSHNTCQPFIAMSSFCDIPALHRCHRFVQ